MLSVTASAFQQRNSALRPVLLFLAATSMWLASAAAQSPDAGKGQSVKHDWPQFLGPQRNGISAETGLLDAFPSSGPKKVWQVKGGVGMSGLAVSGDRALTLVQKEGKQWLLALNAKSGETVWQSSLAPEYHNGMGDGPRATPAISGGRVFTLTGEGILAAVNLADGKTIWSHNLLEELSGKQADYGMACSPLVVGNLVIVAVGAPGATVVAKDVATGKTIWAAGDDAIGYSSPALLEVGGRRQVVVAAGSSILGLDPTSGTVLWRYPFVTDFNCNIATPLAVKDHIFISSGENHGSVLLALKPNRGKVEVEKVWASLGPKSTMRNEWQTSILVGDYLYGFDNVGGAGPVSHLTCIHATTGERVWQKLRFGKGNLIAAEGKLFIVTMDGDLVIVRASPKEFEEMGRVAVCDSTRQAPALVDGMLYLRDGKNIVCLDIRK